MMYDVCTSTLSLTGEGIYWGKIHSRHAVIICYSCYLLVTSGTLLV